MRGCCVQATWRCSEYSCEEDKTNLTVCIVVDPMTDDLADRTRRENGENGVVQYNLFRWRVKTTIAGRTCISGPTCSAYIDGRIARFGPLLCALPLCSH